MACLVSGFGVRTAAALCGLDFGWCSGLTLSRKVAGVPLVQAIDDAMHRTPNGREQSDGCTRLPEDAVAMRSGAFARHLCRHTWFRLRWYR